MLKESLLKLLKLDGFVSTLTGYVETRLELIKLEIKEELAKAIAQLTIMVVFVAAISLFIVFASVSVALLIGEALGYLAGFSIVAGVYLIIAIIIGVLKNSIGEALEQKLKDQLGKR
jgi:uncharacterized membrane protein YqjE